ncbi:MAG: histidine phosphatase family protein [Alcaligenaceae bacterium]|nr:MAG: histidine phosphatase family protein [Alcaligenaceae bacterium]
MIVNNFNDRVEPIAFTGDSDNFYALSNVNRDKTALIEINAKTGKEGRVIYASDLSRAWATALEIARPRGLAVIAEPRLRERAFGQFEGKRFAEIESDLPEQARLWRTRDPAFAPQGGESLLVFRDRVTAVAAELAARHPGELMVLVAHGGVMDVLYRAATRQDLQAPRTWQLGNAAINRMLWTPEGFTLVGWSDNAHLAGQPLDEIDT